MIPAATIARIAALGLSSAQASAVAEMLAEVESATEAKAGAAIAARRASDRERKDRQRHGKSRDVTGQDVTERDTPSPKEIPPTPPKEITPTRTLPSVGVRSARDEAFGRFWDAYPAKVGKDAARKAFDKACDRHHPTIRQLLDGLETYKQTKPADREWCNPATWLNQGRWQDEPPPAIEPRANGSRAGPANPIDAANSVIEKLQRREQHGSYSGAGDRTGDFTPPRALAYR